MLFYQFGIFANLLDICHPMVEQLSLADAALAAQRAFGAYFINIQWIYDLYILYVSSPSLLDLILKILMQVFSA